MNNKEKIETIKPLTLEIDRDLWEDFKNITPRKITLNDAVVGLIKKHINDFGEQGESS